MPVAIEYVCVSVFFFTLERAAEAFTFCQREGRRSPGHRDCESPAAEPFGQ